MWFERYIVMCNTRDTIILIKVTIYQKSQYADKGYDIPKSLYADKGFAPLYPGHEPVMLLLHQPACIFTYNPLYMD